MTQRLAGWMNGRRVGVWSISARGGHVFEYDADWVRSPEGRPLSLSMPILPTRRIEGTAVAAWFDNLLPDSDAIRARLQRRFHARSRQPIDLLAEIGRDAVGALQLLPDDVAPEGYDRIEGEAMSPAQIEAHLRAVAGGAAGAAGDDREFRISLAGAQEKTALLRHRGRWMRPLGATPTTHILKLPVGIVGGMQLDLRHSIENEWLCHRILSHFGLPVAASSIETFGAQRVLVVERFDRNPMRSGKEWIVRLPQEDFCQATGTPPARKYESDGGPSLGRCLKILLAGANPVEDATRLVRTQFVFWLLAAPDGHAKNFSIFLQRGGRYTLTPCYDVLSAWPMIGRGPNTLDYRAVKLALALHSKNPHRLMDDILPRHWRAEIERAGIDAAWDRLLATAADVPRVIDEVERGLPHDFPPRVWEAVARGMRRHAARFEQQLAPGAARSKH